jgi:hypothetical protein
LRIPVIPAEDLNSFGIAMRQFDTAVERGGSRRIFAKPCDDRGAHCLFRRRSRWTTARSASSMHSGGSTRVVRMSRDTRSNTQIAMLSQSLSKFRKVLPASKAV